MSGSEVQAFLKKARRFLDASEVLLAEGFPDRAASSAFYAMFTAAKSMLLASGEKPKYGEVQGAFGRLFAKLDPSYKRYHRYLIDGHTQRIVADYDAEPIQSINEKEARRTLTHAKEFVEMAETFVKNK
jgi:uncharacterized protein (UPF0332 family)